MGRINRLLYRDTDESKLSVLWYVAIVVGTYCFPSLHQHPLFSLVLTPTSRFSPPHPQQPRFFPLDQVNKTLVATVATSWLFLLRWPTWPLQCVCVACTRWLESGVGVTVCASWAFCCERTPFLYQRPLLSLVLTPTSHHFPRHSQHSDSSLLEPAIQLETAIHLATEAQPLTRHCLLINHYNYYVTFTGLPKTRILSE